MLAAAELRLRFFEIDLDLSAIEVSAIQSRNGCTCLMAFHFDETKTFALSGKYIRHQL